MKFLLVVAVAAYVKAEAEVTPLSSTPLLESSHTLMESSLMLSTLLWSTPLPLMQKLTLRLTHGCCTADTTDTHMDIMLHLPTMVRDLLMLSQRLMLVLTLM